MTCFGLVIWSMSDDRCNEHVHSSDEGDGKNAATKEKYSVENWRVLALGEFTVELKSSLLAVLWIFWCHYSLIWRWTTIAAMTSVCVYKWNENLFISSSVTLDSSARTVLERFEMRICYSPFFISLRQRQSSKLKITQLTQKKKIITIRTVYDGIIKTKQTHEKNGWKWMVK